MGSTGSAARRVSPDAAPDQSPARSAASSTSGSTAARRRTTTEHLPRSGLEGPTVARGGRTHPEPKVPTGPDRGRNLSDGAIDLHAEVACQRVAGLVAVGDGPSGLATVLPGADRPDRAQDRRGLPAIRMEAEPRR